MMAQQLWNSAHIQFRRVSTFKVARLEEELDKLSIFESENLVDKLGDFNHIKRQLEKYGTRVDNPIHKLLGKLPSYFKALNDNIYLRVPFLSYEDALGLFHEKYLTCKPSSKHD